MANDIRVLIVDDSAVMRAMLADHVAAATGMSVARRRAQRPRGARRRPRRSHPDVITLDLQDARHGRPGVLDALLEREPVRVIMVSALTRSGAAVTLEALDHGRVDYVAKPEAGGGHVAVRARADPQDRVRRPT